MVWDDPRPFIFGNNPLFPLIYHPPSKKLGEQKYAHLPVEIFSIFCCRALPNPNVLHDVIWQTAMKDVLTAPLGQALLIFTRALPSWQTNFSNKTCLNISQTMLPSLYTQATTCARVCDAVEGRTGRQCLNGSNKRLFFFFLQNDMWELTIYII